MERIRGQKSEKLKKLNGASGKSDIEGKVTRVGARERRQRPSFKRCREIKKQAVASGNIEDWKNLRKTLRERPARDDAGDRHTINFSSPHFLEEAAHRISGFEFRVRRNIRQNGHPSRQAWHRAEFSRLSRSRPTQKRALVLAMSIHGMFESTGG